MNLKGLGEVRVQHDTLALHGKKIPEQILGSIGMQLPGIVGKVGALLLVHHICNLQAS
jgi:hypothetical protein